MKIIKNIFLLQRHKGAKFFLATLCLCSITFISCSKKEEKIPENILSKEKMIAVMVDVQVAEASIQNRNLNMTDSTKLIAAGFYKNLFQKNKYYQMNKTAALPSPVHLLKHWAVWMIPSLISCLLLSLSYFINCKITV